MAIKDLPPPIKTPDSGASSWSQLLDWLLLVWKFARTPALVLSPSGDAPTTPTGPVGDASTQIANDAFVQRELGAGANLPAMYGMSGVEGAVSTIPTPAVPSSVPTGTILTFSGTTAPSGYLTCPTAQTNVSRTGSTAALFAVIGTTWGVGDGSTTFGMPWFPPDYSLVQANGNVGTQTVGALLAHTHTWGFAKSFTDGSATNVANNGGNNYGTTSSTGGAANLAAGSRVLICVKL